jgi:hypothetical protein
LESGEALAKVQKTGNLDLQNIDSIEGVVVQNLKIETFARGSKV